MTLPLVIIESPFAASTPERHERNVRYARAAMRDSLQRGEAPFLSHLLYTQVLDDKDPPQREKGIAAGLAWGAAASLTAVYADLGISNGMNLGIERATRDGRLVSYRYLGDDWDR